MTHSANVVPADGAGQRVSGLMIAALLGVMAAGFFTPCAHAQPLFHWTWEGAGEEPTTVSGDTEYWWVDKISGQEMRLGDHPERYELPGEGPGSAFAHSDEATSGWGIVTSEGWVRTPDHSDAFHRDSFTAEIFFNAEVVGSEQGDEHRLWQIRRSGQQAHGMIRNGRLAARVYNPDGTYNSSGTNVYSSFSITPGKDYYAAFAISTGENEEDRYVDFYLKNLTDDGELQHQRVAIDDAFTSLFQDTVLQLRVGDEGSFAVIGEVRYSGGVLDEDELLVLLPPDQRWPQPRGEPVGLSNQYLALEFDEASHYAVKSLVHEEKETEFLLSGSASGLDRSLWILTMRDAAGGTLHVRAEDAGELHHQVDEDQLTLSWSEFESEGEVLDLAVQVTVRLAEGDRKSYWDIEVTGESEADLWQVDFPRFTGVRSIGDDHLAIPYSVGRLMRQPVQQRHAHRIPYPARASMQYFAFWGTPDAREPDSTFEAVGEMETGWQPDRSDAAGLYWAAEDGEAHFKKFVYDANSHPGRLNWWVEHIPALAEWPLTERTRTISYSPPYPVAVGVFTGDYHEAAQLYREWAQDQVWTARGPADVWPTKQPEKQEDLVRWVPPWFREIGFWAKFYHEPSIAVSEWANYRDWLKVPMASHYYRYNLSRFDDNYPEHFPLAPYFREGMRDAVDMDVRPLPYVQGGVWDMTTQAWFRQNAAKSAMLDEGGNYRVYGGSLVYYTFMCPSERLWQDKLAEVSEKLVLEQGARGIYLDVLAHSSARACYAPGHNHAPRGGNYQGMGNRELLHRVKSHIRQVEPEAAYFSEGINEIYLDLLDGNLTLDYSRGHLQGTQTFPLTKTVYGPSFINFGGDADLNYDVDDFALEMGTHLVWGSQPLNSNMGRRVKPQAGDPNSEILREVAQFHYRIGRHFLLEGHMRKMAIVPHGTPDTTAGLELKADPYQLDYRVQGGRTRSWEGPAVLASAWDRQGDIALVMMNVTGEDREVELSVRPEALGLGAGVEMVRMWPGQPETVADAFGTRTITIPAYSILMEVITDDAGQLETLYEEVDETPEKLVTVEDGLFPEIDVESGSLWASSDGPLQNETVGGSASVIAMWYDEGGQLVQRRGFNPPERGHHAEGHGLPRDADRKPFVLHRKLPHRVVSGQGQLTVLAGGDQYLSAIVPNGVELAFEQPGVIVATDFETGEVVRSINEPLADRIRAKSGKTYLVGYARFTADEFPAVRDSLSAAGDEAIAHLDELQDRLLTLSSEADADRDALLAQASEAAHELRESLQTYPSAFSTVDPFTYLQEKLAALVNARVGGMPYVRTEHDWLAPEIPMPTHALAVGSQRFLQDVATMQLTASAKAGREAFAMEEMEGGNIEHDQAAGRSYELTLVAPRYIERMVPVTVSMQSERDGLTFHTASTWRLEANQPFEVRPPGGERFSIINELSVLAGGSESLEMTIRNWSPWDLEIRGSDEGDSRISAEVTPERISVPALSDAKATVQYRVADDISGMLRQAVPVAFNHGQDADGGHVVATEVNVLPTVEPFDASDTNWTVPELDESPQLRGEGLRVVYLEAGEALQTIIENKRVTRYTHPVKYEVKDPYEVEPLVTGSIEVDAQDDVQLTAPYTGLFFIDFNTGLGSARIRTLNRYAADVAAPWRPLSTIWTDVTRYFHVPADATSFRVGASARDWERATIRVVSPSGRMAYERRGAFEGTEVTINVEPDEADGVWQLEMIEPVQGMKLWLSGDASPYLSTSPQRVLKMKEQRER